MTVLCCPACVWSSERAPVIGEADSVAGWECEESARVRRGRAGEEADKARPGR